MLRNRRPSHARATQVIAVLTLALASGFAAAPGLAQRTDTPGTAEVSVPRANFRADCSLDAEVVATLTEGEELEVLSTAGSWYRVRHTESGIEGCMHQTVVGAVTPLSGEEAEELAEWEEESREREQEAREAQLEAERERREAEQEAERERREAELEAREEEAERSAREAEWAARRARGEKRVTGYLDLNIGYGTPGEDRLHTAGAFINFGTDPPTPIPNSHHEDDYRYGSDLAYGISGGVLVALHRGGSIGGGASIAQTSYTVDLHLDGSAPHPTRGVVVGDDISAQAPDRTESALHVHGVYAPATPEQLRVRIFLGPTIFRVELPVWDTVFPEFFDNPPRIEFVDIEFAERKETVIGGHVGADVTYFFSRVFGIGGGLLYSEGTEEFEFSPPDLPGDERSIEEVTVGGLSAMFGVRFRF